MSPSSHTRFPLLAIASLLALMLAGCASDGASASPTPTEMVGMGHSAATCAQIQGFADAAALSLPSLQFPSGTVAQAPRTSGGGAGQYIITTYHACAPNTDASLTMDTGREPGSFVAVATRSGWVAWGYFPADGGAQTPCPSVCLALNAEDASKGWFTATPTFLALSDVTDAGHGVVTFTLAMTTPPPAPDCSALASGGPAPQYAVWYDQAANIQFPPDTISSPDATMSTDGSVQCGPGTVASVKAFMEGQLQAAGYASDPCQAYDCWRKGAALVSLQLTSATQWFIFTPRALPTTGP